MYRAPVKALFDAKLTKEQQGAAVEEFTKTFIADGYWMSRNGQLFVTSCGDNTVKRMNPDRTFAVVAKDEPVQLAGQHGRRARRSDLRDVLAHSADEDMARLRRGAQPAVPLQAGVAHSPLPSREGATHSWLHACHHSLDGGEWPQL